MVLRVRGHGSKGPFGVRFTGPDHGSKGLSRKSHTNTHRVGSDAAAGK